MKKKINKDSPAGRIIITLVGIALILLAVNSIGLTVLGKKATALDIQTSRYSSNADMNRDVDEQYKWTVTYKFIVNGKEYSGSNPTRGSSYGVKTNKTVSYYPFAPQINSMYAEDSVGWGTLICFLVGGFLIVIVNIKPKKSPDYKGKTVKQIADEMTTYDDSVEEFFDENGGTPAENPENSSSATSPRSSFFCPYCGTKLDNNERFCPNCGAATREK